MSLIRPFRGLRPAPGRLPEVAAPPYDVVSVEEARMHAERRPWSFLRISRPELELDNGTDPHDEKVYAQGAESFRRMRDQEILIQDPVESYYVYRITAGDWVQTGLAAAASVAAYEDNRIRRHEHTRPDKVRDRARQIDSLNAHTGPVLMSYRRSAAVQAILEEIATPPPAADVMDEDGVHHALWVVDDIAHVEAINTIFAQMPCVYIADGHHRSEAAAVVARARREDRPPVETDAAEYFLAVLFAEDQVRILDYNRAVTDLGGLSSEAFLQQVSARVSGALADSPVRPAARGEFGMYPAGNWYQLKLADELIPASDPVARVSTSLLSTYVLEPILGVGDPRSDQRLECIGGSRGLKALQAKVDSGAMAVAFSFYPTPITDLLDVADAERLMPPKSTWFDPKLADGVVSHLLD
ncbi:MAG: DUF1015 domain-containing protein [Gammaproteobacteria bacterium]|nr:MAG: DUF1015 domain-containing protein [Gammaproteobacteria bacterium]